MDQLQSDKPITPEIKEQIQNSIDRLQKLYDEDINQEGTTESKTLLYIPLFIVEGLLLASMFGVSSDELLAITDYLIERLGVAKEERDEAEE